MGPLPRIVAAVGVLALLPTVAAAQTAELHGQLADTHGERERVEQELDEARVAEGDARARLAAVEEELATAESSLAHLEQELAAAESGLAAAQERADVARERLRGVTAELQVAEAELADKQQRLDARVRAAFKYGQVSFAGALMGESDISDFLNSSTYVAHVLNDDKELVEDVSALLGIIEVQRATAQTLRLESEREAAAAQAAAREVELAAAEQARLTELVRERREEREAVFVQLREDRTAIEGHLAGLEAESLRIEAELAEIARQQAEAARRAEEEARRAEEEARRQAEAARAVEQARLNREAEDRCAVARAANPDANDPDVVEACGPAPRAPEVPIAAPPAGSGGNPPAAGGGWTRPVTGGVTSPFGPRWGRNHNGVDLAGSVGTTVVAARAGTVVHVTNGCHPTSSWSCGGGFGNYVTIAHDAGLATIYAHLSSVAVGTGQQVAAGQSVGAVGNSGNSYGPHLHFEVRDNGSPRNPCGYIGC